MFIPGPGLVGHIVALANTTQYVVLGPMPAGAVVDTLRISLTCSGAAAVQVVAVAAVIGSSHEGTLVAISAGRSLIRFSDVATIGPQTVNLGFAATGGERRLEIPVGILIKGGPQWVIVGVRSSLASPNAGLVASIATLQRIGDAVGRGPAAKGI